MEGSTSDHSDSDSGESWTLLEHTPTEGERDVPDYIDTQSSQQRQLPIYVEKDEETDGISIISDSDPESSTPCDLTYDYIKCLEQNNTTQEHTPKYISLSTLQPNNDSHHEPMQNDGNILGDISVKQKTYVHRRNKRLSTVLNIIMLGSVITAAGVAIGHMWGAKNDCSLHTTPSVNKILSNLYKLQEENAYLRGKLKELTLVNMQGNHKSGISQIIKQQRCKKVYEESINNRNAEKATKCLDNNVDHELDVHMVQPEYEKDFLHDIDKLKHTFEQNKSWLDEEVTKRMKREVISKPMKNTLKSTNFITVEEEIIESKEEVNKPKQTKQIEATEPKCDFETEQKPFKDGVPNKTVDMKISYADSLKFEHEKIFVNENKHKICNKERKTKKNKKGEESNFISEIILSEQEFKKDDRYIAPKNKQEKTKHDRQKSHKKQKRKNKYEQWEMKGGYLKDYDEVSTTSQDNEYVLKRTNKNKLNPDLDSVNQHNDYLKKLNSNKSKYTSKDKNKENYPFKSKLSDRYDKNKENYRFKIKLSDWYDKNKENYPFKSKLFDSYNKYKENYPFKSKLSDSYDKNKENYPFKSKLSDWYDKNKENYPFKSKLSDRYNKKKENYPFTIQFSDRYYQNKKNYPFKTKLSDSYDKNKENYSFKSESSDSYDKNKENYSFKSQLSDSYAKNKENYSFKSELSDSYDKNKENYPFKSELSDWYDKRSTFQSKARKKLEQKIFGEMTPNSARWYFRRMQKRGHSRVRVIIILIKK